MTKLKTNDETKNGTCVMAEMRKDRTSSDKNKYYWMWREEKKKHESEIEALKTQLHIDRENLKKEADELMMKKIEHYEKEIALVREDGQANNLTYVKQLDLKQKELDRSNKDKNDLFIRIRDLEEDKIKKLRLSGL